MEARTGETTGTGLRTGGARLPAIDLEVPGLLATATFALG